MKTDRNSSSLVTTIISVVAFFLILAVFGKSQAAGLLKPKTGDSSAIAIKSHDVSVVINNGFSKTEVDQVFTNSGDDDLEAIYSFPLPRQASLSEVSLWINNQEVIGEVLEKQHAKAVYEEQKANGNSSALAEKDDFKTFNVSVYPVKAQADTRVRLVYYQPLNIDMNIGRYVYPLQEGGVDDERIAFWSVDSAVKESFTFNLTLKSALPIKDVRLPGYTQQAQIEQLMENGEEEAGNTHIYHARLDFTEGANLSEDVVFYYRLDDTAPARVEIIPYKDTGSATGSFMLTLTPGASLARITEGVDWVFVLDKSGSMGGGKIQTLTEGVSKVIGKMSPADRFRIVTFNKSADDLTHGFITATPENVQNALSTVNGITAGGGTALHAGLKLGLKKMDDERTTAMILVTDGVANIGPTRHADFLQLVDAQDIRLFTFVIGNSSNRPLLNNLAKASGGFAMDISPGDDIYGRILQAKSKVLHEAFHDVEVTFSGGKIDELTPASPGTLFRGQQLVMFGKYTKPGPVTISMKAKISGAEHEWTSTAVLPETDTDNPEVERLWALSAIDEIMEEIRLHGENEKNRNEVIQLGTEYSLVTDYTSMVVLDEQEMERLGIQRSNSKRVSQERTAQEKREASPVKSYRTDNDSGGMFKGAPSPGIGSGPVGPWLLILLAGCGWLVRRKS